METFVAKQISELKQTKIKIDNNEINMQQIQPIVLYDD